jgi:hypothetical protein
MLACMSRIEATVRRRQAASLPVRSCVSRLADQDEHARQDYVRAASRVTTSLGSAEALPRILLLRDSSSLDWIVELRLIGDFIIVPTCSFLQHWSETWMLPHETHSLYAFN